MRLFSYPFFLFEFHLNLSIYFLQIPLETSWPKALGWLQHSNHDLHNFNYAKYTQKIILNHNKVNYYSYFIFKKACFLVPMLRKFISFNFLMILSILANNLTILAVLLTKPEFSSAIRLTLPSRLFYIFFSKHQIQIQFKNFII